MTKTTTLLGIPVEKIDKSKYIKQLRSVRTWINNNGRGTVEAATGFGKSIVACLAIAKMKKKNPERTAIIVVPTKALKDQWESVCAGFGLEVDVYVINTVALKDKLYKTNLLILDEIHLFAADQFSNVFHRIKYNFIMGLTATVKRLDGREVYIAKFCPIVVTITQKEAIQKGWINDFIEINCPVYLNRDEIMHLDSLSRQIRQYTAQFGSFDTMRDCMNVVNAIQFASLYYPSLNPNEKAKDIVRDAVQGQRCVKKRQEILYNAQQKVDVTVKLIKEFNLKTITFAQSTIFADNVRNKLGKLAVVYHSNIESVVRMIEKVKEFKTKVGLDRHLEVYPNRKGRKGKFYEAYWSEPKTIGITVLKQEAIDKFSTGEAKYMCTAKALDQGFDDPSIELGIDASRTTNPTQHTQRTG